MRPVINIKSLSGLIVNPDLAVQDFHLPESRNESYLTPGVACIQPLERTLTFHQPRWRFQASYWM